MEVKTYARARVAKAKARDIMNMHEFPEGVYGIETFEMEANRFAAKVIVDFAELSTISVAADALDLLLADLAEAGFVAEVISADDSKTAAEVLDEEIAGYRRDAEEEAAQGIPAEVANPADVPLPRKSGYINEMSGFIGVVAYCHSVIPELVAKGMTRKAVIDELRARGVAYGTARTQYQNWFNPPKPKKEEPEEA